MEKYKVFMIMPFKDEYFRVFQILSEEYQDKFEFSHAATIENQRDIFSDVMEGIYTADVIIADLTEKNANVYYELGIAHTLEKKVIVITQNINDLPFDIKNYRAQEYNMDYIGFKSLIGSLQKLLEGAVNEEIIFSNPVKNFMNTENVNKINLSDKVTNSKEIHISDENSSIEEGKGFIEFMEDIQTHTEKLTLNIGNMNNDLDEMTNSMNMESKKIQEIQSQGSDNTNFIKKAIKNTAQYISIFNNKMEIHNENYKKEWNEIEKNILGLMDNKFIYTKENKDGLKVYLKTLYEMKNAIIGSNAEVKSMVKTFNQSKGMERTLNQAIELLEIKMNDYLITMEQIIASIDRIIERGILIVGDILVDEKQD